MVGGKIKKKTVISIVLLLALALTLSQNAFAVEPTSNVKFTSSQINSASSTVKNYVETYHRLPGYVPIGGTRVTMPQFLQLMTKNVQNINSKTPTSINLKSVNKPSLNYENTKMGIITKLEYLSISKSVSTSITSTGKAPNPIGSSVGLLGFNNQVYSYSKILSFYRTYKRLPNYVTVNPWPYNLSWVSLSHYTYHHQTTEYTCGPSSLKMAFSHYNLTVSENWLAKVANSNPNTGTSQNGMIAAVNAVNAKYGTTFSMNMQQFTGWHVINYYLARGIPVIVRVHSWIDTYGTHYVLITGINLKTGKVRLADPSYNGKGTFSVYDKGVSIHEVTINELQNRIQWMLVNGKATKPVMVLFNS